MVVIPNQKPFLMDGGIDAGGITVDNKKCMGLKSSNLSAYITVK
jgi:hypothetical protein